jgi:restriction system protein
MDPAAIESLSMRLLREAGFRNVEALGRSGDGGIGGLGVYKVSLVSFATFFRCKRYAGSVSAGAVRDFRGAMTGRGEKSLILTTGTSTPAAKTEATRYGAPPVDLIDGDDLCELLKDYGLGVAVKERIVEDVEVNVGFFGTI